MEKRLIITIDGPSGVGKSTIAKLVAKKMGFLYVDTGAIYRAITWKALQSNIDLKNEDLLLKLIIELQIEFKHIEHNKNNYYKIFLDKIDVTRKIRGPRIDQYVSDLAKLPKIREQLISLQRNLAKDGNIVM
ncbi:MAG: (d)CMP kinase, partial [Candidatus Atribacteria bacterium]|nr:(d)CMP kinase [Candidatus Atribacteria bacterium]